MRFSTIVACVAVVAGLALVPIGAVAQDATNATDDRAAAQLEDRDVKERVDETLAITDWSYSDDTFTLTFHSDESQTITVAEAIRAEEGTGRVTWDSYDLEEGNSTIDVPVRTAPSNTDKGAAITIASERSMQAGHATYVSSGMIEPDRGPVDYGYVQLMVLVSGAGGAGLAFRWVRKRREDETMEVEQIA